MLFRCRHLTRWRRRAAWALTLSILSACSTADAPKLLPACEGESCGADGNRFRGVGLGIWEYRNETDTPKVLPIALEGLYRSQVMVSLTNMTDAEVDMPAGLRGVVLDVPAEASPASVPPPVAIPYDPDRPGRDGGAEAGSNPEMPDSDTALITQTTRASLAKTLLPQQRVVLQKNDVSGMYERGLTVPSGVRVRVYVR
jgi:hypothetical protein